MRISDWSSDVCSSDLFRACTAPCDPPRRTDRQPPAVTTPATPDSPDAAPPLTIVVGCDTFSPDINGAARFAERLSAGLVERGHDVHVMAPNRVSRRAKPHTEVIAGQPMTLHTLPAVRGPQRGRAACRARGWRDGT